MPKTMHPLLFLSALAMDPKAVNSIPADQSAGGSGLGWHLLFCVAARRRARPTQESGPAFLFEPVALAFDVQRGGIV